MPAGAPGPGSCKVPTTTPTGAEETKACEESNEDDTEEHVYCDWITGVDTRLEYTSNRERSIRGPTHKESWKIKTKDW